MTPELVVQLVQLGAIGLLAMVLYFIMSQGSRFLDSQAAVLKSLIEGNQRLMEKLIDTLLTLEDERSALSKAAMLIDDENASSHQAR